MRSLCFPANRFLRNAHSLRCLQTSAVLASGHSRWSKIKHDKGKVDDAKTKQRTNIARELTLVSKQNGPDPATNPRLSTLIANARKAGFPKQSIEAAIARGQGKSTSGNALESVTIEAMLPNAVAAIIECQTDSKGRLLHEIRDILKQHDATVTPTTYLFERKGRVIFEPSTTVGGDELLEQAIEAGALDVETNDDGQIVVYTAPSELYRVGQDLVKALDLKIESSDFLWDPKKDSVVNVESPDMAERLTKFISQVEEDPSVQNVYLNTM